MLVAGVDSSTQSCKIVIRDADTGAVVREGRAVHPPGTEVDPEAWWLALSTAVEDAGGLADVGAISVAGQQHGLVALDAGGKVIRPALLWNDTRSASAARDLVTEVGAAEYAARTGSVPVASFTCTKLRWLRDTEPENAERVAAVALPHDWLTWRLRGFGPGPTDRHGPDLDSLVTDRSEASGTGYWDPSTGEYDRDLLVRALGHDVVLPRVLGPGERAGTSPAGLVVGPGAGDNAGAALGLDLTAGDVVVSIGTSGTVFGVSPRPVVDATGTVAGFADATGSYLPLTATLNAARVLRSVADLLDVDDDALARLALEAEPGSGGIVLVPWFEGERTPNRPDARASLHGLSLASTTRANLARAAVEGMLCGLAAGLQAVREAGVRGQRIMLIGGAAQNDAVRLVAAQVFEAEVTVPEPEEYVARGAAAQAAWVLSGSRPRWVAPAHLRVEGSPHPGIQQQYRHYADRA
ncbi:MAG: xylB [Nocardioides sp.]|nr:xylB [Nocardioides sp.]